MNKMIEFFKKTHISSRILFGLWIFFSVFANFSNETRLQIIVEFGMLFLMPALLIELFKNPVLKEKFRTTNGKATIRSNISKYLFPFRWIYIIAIALWIYGTFVSPFSKSDGIILAGIIYGMLFIVPIVVVEVCLFKKKENKSFENINLIKSIKEEKMVADINLETYLTEQEANYQKKNEKMEKRKKRFKKKALVFSIIFGVLVVLFFGIDIFTKNSLYNDLKDMKISDTEKMDRLASSLTAMRYPDLFDKFESGYLGNKSMNSLNYGLVADNQFGYTSTNETGETLLHTNGKEVAISTEQISQINIGKDIVAFRGSDKKLYTCKHDGSDKKAIVNDRVGTVVLSGDTIYYVNYSKSNDLYKYNLKDKKSELVFEADVKNFTVVADSILYMDYSNKLMLQSIDSTTPSWTNANVVKFYFNGEVFVQNNDKIIKFNLNNHFPEDIATGVNEFLGVDENNIYYTIKNKLYSQKLDNGEKKELSYKFDYYKGVYSANGKITALGGVKE